MSDFEQLRKQQQQQIQTTQQQQAMPQQMQRLQQADQAYATKETQDTMTVQDIIQANAYLQDQRDADAAEPDENREELLTRQARIGLGKATAIKQAEDAARGAQ